MENSKESQNRKDGCRLGESRDDAEWVLRGVGENIKTVVRAQSGQSPQDENQQSFQRKPAVLSELGEEHA